MRTLFIPQSLDIAELSREFKVCPGFKESKVHFVCNAIITKSLHNKGNEREHRGSAGYVSLHSSIIRHYLGNNYCSQIINWMILAGIIEIDRSWEANIVSMGYRFTEKYAYDKAIEVEVTDFSMWKKKPFDYSKKSNKVVEPSPIVRHIIKSFGNLSIDGTNARIAVEEKYEEDMTSIEDSKSKKGKAQIKAANARRTRGLAVINAIVLNECRKPFQDSTGRRLHSVITAMPKTIREFVTYDGYYMAEADLSNSFLYCTLFLLSQKNWTKSISKNNIIWEHTTFSKSISSFYSSMLSKIPETLTGKGFEDQNFADLVCSGEVYDYLTNILTENSDFFATDLTTEQRRGIVKKLLIQQINAKERPNKIDFKNIDSKRTKESLSFLRSINKAHRGLYVHKNGILWDVFTSNFPSVAYIYDQIKAPNYLNLSGLLQRIESTGVLEYSCKLIKKQGPDLPVFPLHDCLVTTVQHIDTVKQGLLDGMNNLIGQKPSVTIKYWNELWDQYYNIEPTLGNYEFKAA